MPRADGDSNHDAELQSLLQEQDLCALNTFHAKPSHTYHSTTARSQIEYILVRTSDAGAHAKHAKPMSPFPVAGERLVNHKRRLLWHCGLSPCSPVQRDRQHQYDVNSLQQAASENSPAAQALQGAVANRVAQLEEQHSVENPMGGDLPVLAEWTQVGH